MNKKVWGILGATVLSLSVTTQLSFANEQESTSNMQLAAYNVRSQANANQIINFAKQQLGKPYAWGATGPNSFDCSGFIYYVFSNNGYSISRTSVAGYWGDSNIKKVSTPKPGDLIFFKGTYGGSNNPSHIGIVINDHQFIQASSTRGVCITEMSNSYWRQHFLGYGRIIPEQTTRVPVYRLEAAWFEGIGNTQNQARLIKDRFGLNGEIVPIDEKSRYMIVTGWFEGLENAQNQLQLIKDRFGLHGEIVGNDEGATYKLVTGTFEGLENTQNQLQLIKDRFGLHGEIESTEKTNEYRIVIKGFNNEQDVQEARNKLKSIDWWSTYSTDWGDINNNHSNRYKIIIKGYDSEQEAQEVQEKLKSIDWWSTYEKYHSNRYKIVINGLLGEQAAKDAQQKLKSIDWGSTYEFTGEYKDI